MSIKAVGFPRRKFLKQGLGLGYAWAAQPLWAQAIHTDFSGVNASERMLERDGFSFPVYVAQPDVGEHWPLVLVVSEVFGVHEYIADVCRRFAKLGYMAMAPELFARQGEPSEYATLAALLTEVVERVPDQQVWADLDACLDWAQANGADMQRVGVNGFCWGGRIAWGFAARSHRLKAAVAWYGRLEGEHTPNSPSHPIDWVNELKAPVLGLYGGDDASIPMQSLQRMQTQLHQAAQLGLKAAEQSRLVIYPNAGHAFHADYRSSYVPQVAQSAWQETQAWLKRWC